MRRTSRLAWTLILLASIAPAQPTEKLKASLQRIFNSNEFAAGGRGGGRRGGGGGTRWIEGGRAYAAIEGGEIVRYDTATGKREVWVSAAQLNHAQPSDFAWSAGGAKLMIATKPHRVLIRKNAAEYRVLDTASGKWHTLGGDKAADLLFAKLSPDGTRAAYVRGTNLYVEDLATGKIKALTTSGTDLILNGVSDWVYDEEFSLADGFRWSPDGQRIAYWQFDQTGVPEYTLVNYTDGLYPTLFKYPYPKAGQTNSAVRVGVVSAAGGATTWMKAPGDPRNIYIPRMEWAGNGGVIFEQLNRLQNTLDVQLGNPSTGEVRRMFRDQDAAWVEVNDQIRWLEAGKRLLWTSEKDGWRHAYSVSRDGEMRLLTRDAGDVISIAAVDESGGWLYYIASPEEPTRRYLYRTRLDGSARAERVTPANSPGVHGYDIAPNAQWAVHSHSRFDQPAAVDLVRLPSHETVRVQNENLELRKKVADVLGGRTEFVEVDAGDGVKIDGWVMKPRDFDPAKKYPILVYVYGEPASATAMDQWSGNRTLFHAAIADEGYLVASFDNSGTPSPKGRAWRKSIYGEVGVLASRQQAAALRSLAAMKRWSTFPESRCGAGAAAGP